MIIMKNYTQQHGLTLIELMVALVISLLILAGLFTVYQSNQRGYRLNDGLVRVQESGRFAIDFLSRDVRQAAYPANDPNANSIVPPEFHFFLFTGGANDVDIAGTNAGDYPPSDILSLRHGFSTLASPDCNGNTPANGGNTDPIGIPMTQGATTWVPDGTTTWNRYDIRNTGRQNNRGNPIFALYCNGIELVEGIENMQVLYGVDTSQPQDFVVDQYFTYNNVPDVIGDLVTDWGRVISVRIALLASSVDEKANAPSSRSFNLLGNNLIFDGTGVDANGNAIAADQKIRRVYTTTVLIRNNISS